MKLTKLLVLICLALASGQVSAEIAKAGSFEQRYKSLENKILDGKQKALKPSSGTWVISSEDSSEINQILLFDSFSKAKAGKSFLYRVDGANSVDLLSGFNIGKTLVFATPSLDKLKIYSSDLQSKNIAIGEELVHDFASCTENTSTNTAVCTFEDISEESVSVIAIQNSEDTKSISFDFPEVKNKALARANRILPGGWEVKRSKTDDSPTYVLIGNVTYQNGRMVFPYQITNSDFTGAFTLALTGEFINNRFVFEDGIASLYSLYALKLKGTNKAIGSSFDYLVGSCSLASSTTISCSNTDRVAGSVVNTVSARKLF